LKAVGTFYAAQTLAFLSSFGGLACLAGAALTVAALARNSELVAARAAGVSLRRAFLPLVVFAGLCGAGQTVLAEKVVRRISPAADDAMDFISGRKTNRGRDLRPPRSANTRLAVWASAEKKPADLIWQGRGHIDFVAGRLRRDGLTIEMLSITMPSADGADFIVYTVCADRARWRGGDWELTGGHFWDHSKEPAVRDCARITCDVTPTKLEARALGLAGLTLGETFELRNDPEARVEIWKRLAPPLTNVVLLLIGLPLAVMGGARGGKLLPLGMALVLGMLYILSAELGAQVACGGGLLNLLERFEGGNWLRAMGGPLRLAVDAAMGLPHLLFLGLGATLYRKMDR
jgi:lipopolysaccharide export LptBFGC system permease protein LptF